MPHRGCTSLARVLHMQEKHHSKGPPGTTPYLYMFEQMVPTQIVIHTPVHVSDGDYNCFVV